MSHGAEPSVAEATRWSGIGQLGGQGLRFVTLLVLGKMLGEDEFGLLTLALLVTGFVELVKSLGTTEFLIRERELPPPLVQGVFALNVLLGAAMSAALWLGAGPLASLLGERAAAPLIRWLGLSFVVLSLTNVQEALLRRSLQFRRLALAQTAGPLAYALCALPAAGLGLREMAFVAGALAEAVVASASLWFLCPWRPRDLGDLAAARRAFGFSAFFSAAEIVRYLLGNADRVLIQHALGTGAVGVYGFAQRVLVQASRPVLTVFGKVVFPALAQVDDPARVRARFVRACAGVALLVFPMMAFFAAAAEPFVALIEADTWRPAVPLLRILAVVVALQSVASTVGVVYLARGRTGLLLAWNLGSGALLVAAYWLGAARGLSGVAWASVVAFGLLTPPAFAVPCWLLGVRLREVFVALGPAALSSLAMAAATWAVVLACHALGLRALAAAVLAGLAGGGVYLLGVRLLRPPGLDDLVEALPGRASLRLRRWLLGPATGAE